MQYVTDSLLVFTEPGALHGLLVTRQRGWHMMWLWVEVVNPDGQVFGCGEKKSRIARPLDGLYGVKVSGVYLIAYKRRKGDFAIVTRTRRGRCVPDFHLSS